MGIILDVYVFIISIMCIRPLMHEDESRLGSSFHQFLHRCLSLDRGDRTMGNHKSTGVGHYYKMAEISNNNLVFFWRYVIRCMGNM